MSRYPVAEYCPVPGEEDLTTVGGLLSAVRHGRDVSKLPLEVKFDLFPRFKAFLKQLKDAGGFDFEGAPLPRYLRGRSSDAEFYPEGIPEESFRPVGRWTLFTALPLFGREAERLEGAETLTVRYFEKMDIDPELSEKGSSKELNECLSFFESWNGPCRPETLRDRLPQALPGWIGPLDIARGVEGTSWLPHPAEIVVVHPDQRRIATHPYHLMGESWFWQARHEDRMPQDGGRSWSVNRRPLHPDDVNAHSHFLTLSRNALCIGGRHNFNLCLMLSMQQTNPNSYV